MGMAEVAFANIRAVSLPGKAVLLPSLKGSSAQKFLIIFLLFVFI